MSLAPLLHWAPWIIFRPIDALSVLCVQLTRDLFAISKFLFRSVIESPDDLANSADYLE